MGQVKSSEPLALPTQYAETLVHVWSFFFFWPYIASRLDCSARMSLDELEIIVHIHEERGDDGESRIS